MSQENETILLDDRNLIAEFLLDGNALDSSRNGYNVTASNVVYTKTDRGYQSQCGVFNGSSSKVDTTFPGLTNNFSVSIELTKGDSDGVAFSMHNAWCRIYSDGTVQATFYDGAVRSISSSAGYVADSNLHHLVWVKTSTNGQAFWLDGVKVAENTSHNGTLRTYTGTPGIGYFRSFNANYTSGKIQSVRIFNAALSEKEIRNRYLHSLRMAGGSSLHGLADGLVSYLDSSDGNELSDILGGKDGTKVSGTATTDNLGYTRAITNPNYTFPSITYTNVYSYENSGNGWGLVANPAGISATAINRTTTFRLALFFNRALNTSEQTVWAEMLAKRYVLPFDVDGRKSLPRQLRANCKLFLTGDYSGTTAYDASGNGNHGTLVNSPTPKRRGGYKGFQFNGSSQYVTVPDNASLRFTSEYTLTGILNVSSLPTNGNLYSLFYKRDQVGNFNGYEFELYNDGGTQKMFISNASASTAVSAMISYAIPTSKFVMVSAVYSSGVATFYLGSTVIGSVAIGIQPTGGTNPLRIGWNEIANGRYFNGMRSQFIAFDKALSKNELRLLETNLFIPS